MTKVNDYMLDLKAKNKKFEYSLFSMGKDKEFTLKELKRYKHNLKVLKFIEQYHEAERKLKNEKQK